MDLTTSNSGPVVIIISILGLVGTLGAAFISKQRSNSGSANVIKKVLKASDSPINSVDQALVLIDKEMQQKDDRHAEDMAYVREQLADARREANRLRRQIEKGDVERDLLKKDIEHLRGVIVELSNRLHIMDPPKMGV